MNQLNGAAGGSSFDRQPSTKWKCCAADESTQQSRQARKSPRCRSAGPHPSRRRKDHQLAPHAAVEKRVLQLQGPGRDEDGSVKLNARCGGRHSAPTAWRMPALLSEAALPAAVPPPGGSACPACRTRTRPASQTRGRGRRSSNREAGAQCAAAAPHLLVGVCACTHAAAAPTFASSSHIVAWCDSPAEAWPRAGSEPIATRLGGLRLQPRPAARLVLARASANVP